MKHFASDYEIDEAIARYEGFPYVAKSCNCWDGYRRVPGTKPCAPGSCEKCDEGCHKKKSSQGDTPSPNAAKAVFEALTSGDESAAVDLLGETDCPQGCDTHPEGKCNHGYMAAGRTRVRYLISDQTFKKSDDNPKEFGTTHYDSPKEAGFLQDLVQMGPDLIQSIPHALHELNPAGTGFVGDAIGTVGDAIDSGVDAVQHFVNRGNQRMLLDQQAIENWRAAHPGPEYLDEYSSRMRNAWAWWSAHGVPEDILNETFRASIK